MVLSFSKFKTLIHRIAKIQNNEIEFYNLIILSFMQKRNAINKPFTFLKTMVFRIRKNFANHALHIVLTSLIKSNLKTLGCILYKLSDFSRYNGFSIFLIVTSSTTHKT